MPPLVAPGAALFYAPEDIVHRHIIIICEHDKVMQRDFPFPALISAVRDMANVQNCGYIRLRLIRILPEVV